MKRIIVPALIVGLIIVALALGDKSCTTGKELAKWKADYAALKADHAVATSLSLAQIDALETENATLRGAVDSANTIIASKDSVISGLKGKVKESNAVTEALRTEVQPVLDANPKVAELVASLDAGIVLRDNLIAEQETLIFTLKERVSLGDQLYANQVAISAEWKSMYEREKALRLNCEQGLGLYEKQVRRSRLWAFVGKYGLPVAVVAGMVLGK